LKFLNLKFLFFKASLDDLITEGLISQQLAGTVMTTFDKCINKALSERARNKVNFKVREKGRILVG